MQEEIILNLEEPLEEFTRQELDILAYIVEKYNEERSDLDMKNPAEEKAYREILKKLKII